MYIKIKVSLSDNKNVLTCRVSTVFDSKFHPEISQFNIPSKFDVHVTEDRVACHTKNVLFENTPINEQLTNRINMLHKILNDFTIKGADLVIEDSVSDGHINSKIVLR